MYPIKRSKPKNLKKQKPQHLIKHSPSRAGSSSNKSRYSPYRILKEYDKRIA